MTSEWSPTSPESWAERLGLVSVPLFGEADNERPIGHHAVLLDGQRATVTFSVASEQLFSGDSSLEWAWSANVNHSLLVDAKRELIYLRRWDSPDALRKLRLPDRPNGAVQMLQQIEELPPPDSDDVVLHLLRAFRLLRSAGPEDDPVSAIRIFNLILVAARVTAAGLIERDELVESKMPSEIVNSLRTRANGQTHLLAGIDLDALSQLRGEWPLQQVASMLLDPSPRYSYTLRPALLLRHASGQLYQEAHLVIERESQLAIPGFGTDVTPRGRPTLGIRFTPPPLARALVQQALSAVQDLASRDQLMIYDPACGSGVFLLEAMRELVARGYRGEIELRGTDISEASCEMARFALEQALLDAKAAGLRVRSDVRLANSLVVPWDPADVVLMNPPFVPWERSAEAEQEEIQTTLGYLRRGRPDKAMAFVWKATQSLKPGGAIATVLPAALLETESGLEWREALASQCEIRLIGRFQGYGYFKASAVEPAFLVLRRPVPNARRDHSTTLLIAKPNREELSLRGLRVRGVYGPMSGFEVFDLPEGALRSSSWLPRAAAQRAVMETLSEQGLPNVDGLFAVNQGARTGDNRAFILDLPAYDQLPKQERKYFRPVAGNDTIQQGRLTRTQFVFFPYNRNGLRLREDADLKRALPTYYRLHLKPREPQLAARAGTMGRPWWTLTREREWQHEERPKLVSTYFGDLGSFAYDSSGEYVVVQGYAWHWRRESAPGSDGDQDPVEPSFSTSSLPWAYLAILNSSPFAAFLGAYCPRVAGGQYNLSSRFVGKIPLPDLTTSSTSADTVRALAAHGRSISEGRSLRSKQVDALVAGLYGISMREPNSLE